jgi:hypothetical protein
MNSYLGMLKHVCSHRLRSKVLHKRVHPGWWRQVRVKGNLLKVTSPKEPNRGSCVRGRSGSRPQAKRWCCASEEATGGSPRSRSNTRWAKGAKAEHPAPPSSERRGRA